MDWSQQVQVYVSWVNSQLRKCPNALPIRELCDPSVCDGTILARLIELISGLPVPEISASPDGFDEKMRNIEAIIEFMQLHKVKMHAIEAEAVVNGDIKSIMRIVLALAAHFKPRSVRPNPSVAAIMQGAAVSLANTKHKVLRSPSISEKRFDFAARSPSCEYRNRLPACRDDDEDLDTNDAAVSRPIAMPPRARSLVSTPSAGTPSIPEVDSGCHVTPSSAPTFTPVGRHASDCQTPEMSEELLTELSETRGLLEHLQQMLLAASPADGQPLSTEGGSQEKQRESSLTPTADEDHQRVLRALEEEVRQRDDRLFAQELRLRQASLRAEAAAEEAAELRRRVAEREAALATQCDAAERLQGHVAALTRDLARCADERDRLSRDLHQRISELERRVLPPAACTAEMEQRAGVFRESVERLRCNLAANDPLHHTLDQLEHCFHYQAAALAPGSAPPPPPPRRIANRPSCLELTRDLKRQPITALQGFPIQRLDQTADEAERSTRLLYYTDKTVTPYMVSIPKRLTEVRLADVRRATAQHSRPPTGGARLRFVFKTHDSEFGTAVKAEVRFDDDVVPAWEDKIVAWITDVPEAILPPHG